MVKSKLQITFKAVFLGFLCVFQQKEGNKNPAESSVIPAESAGTGFCCTQSRVFGCLQAHLQSPSLSYPLFQVGFGSRAMQTLASRTLSTSSLDRGVQVLRTQTMTLENDPAMQELMAEKERLLAPCP